MARVNGSLSNMLSLENGILQGSIFSPLLFTVMTDELPVMIYAQHALFADDCVIWSDGRRIPELVRTIQSSLDSISNLCKEWGFVISLDKLVAMIFSRKRNVGPLSLQYKGYSLDLCRELQISGSHFQFRALPQKPY